MGDQPRLLDPFYKNTEGGREENGRKGRMEGGQKKGEREGETEGRREGGLCLIFKQDI